MKALKYRLVCIQIAAFGIALFFSHCASAADIWIPNNAYAIDDYCQLQRGVPLSTYKCIAAHTSNYNNKPPLDGETLWVQVYPKDPPVTSGGEGQTGNDWIDFGLPDNVTLKYLNGGIPSTYLTIEVFIRHDNPNFTTANNTNAIGDKIPHSFYFNNYGGSSGPSITSGNDFWDLFNQGYTPAISDPLTNCTVTTNCICAAFNNYADNAVSTNATPPEFMNLFAEDLHMIYNYGPNRYLDTIIDDRCITSTHVWWITNSDTGCGAFSLRWKNGPSGEYSWSPGYPGNNDGPSGYGNFYEWYEIRNKVYRGD